ncbi:hypothetical protein [Polyangium sp. y55x31]|uniref:P-loop ATPase, Sll1717 family n=1 Tax=Polyangium sp. y55x31 TaxID=3042688 RepID=UPI0024822257|nr:hypothetical protein [Polyangium sp. y55x31]MDI1482641.1 hypothetical protein [Polyangium sp. y55x31]
MTNEDRQELLRALRSDAGQAEGAKGRTEYNFYPITEHLRALEPEVVLIVGDRGAGKSQLVAVARDPDLREAALRRAPSVQFARGEAAWIKGYPMEYGPSPFGLQNFVLSHRDHIKAAAQEFWFTYLFRVLRGLLPEDTAVRFARLLDEPGAEVEERFADRLRAGDSLLVALDNLDKKLTSEDRWVFVMYDELDTLYYSDWWAMGALIRGLIGFWASHGRRWSRIRPKIFLRTDFYRHHGSDVAGAEIAKLAATRVELSWSDKNLYGALLKHIANLNDAWFEYCNRGKGDKVRFEYDSVLKNIPLLVKKEDAKPLVDRLVGPYMGATKGKGESFPWILDHLRDGNGKVSPRSLVLLFENAAVLELGNLRATGAQVLSHFSLRNALDKVSESYVTQAADEFHWLPMVRERLKAISQVPWESRRVIELALKANWDAWSAQNPEQRLPADTPRELVDVLLELGILRDRGGDKYDVPDLYLHGLGLKRKGGVSKGGTRQPPR